MRVGALVAMASACSALAPRSASHVARTPVQPPPPKLEQTMIPASAPPADVRIAPPAGAIHALAVTPDGGAALTGDESGGTRLWPALDGSQEPRVVAIDRAVELAVTRRPDGFLAGVVDDDHGLTLVQLDGEGRTRAHRSVGGDPSVVAVRAVTAGIVAWTSDQKLALYDLAGHSKSTLGTRPGERLVALATNGAHAIAELELSGSVPAHRLRALAIEPALAWGDFVDANIEPTGPIAVSPSGKRVAMIANGPVVIVDAEHDTKLASLPSAASALAFVGESHVAAMAGELQWFEAGGLAPTFVVGPTQQVAALNTAFVAAGDQLVTVIAGGLALATSQHIGYLGYAITAPMMAVGAGSGSLIVSQGNATALVDAQLQTHGAVDFGAPDALAWLGGDDWLVNGPELRVRSSRDAAASVGVPGVDKRSSPMLRYEPATQIATASYSATSNAYLWDAKARVMTLLASDRSRTPYRQTELAPTDPSRAGGVQLVRVTIRENSFVEWFSDTKLTARTASYHCNAVLAIDRAGRVYALTKEPAPHVAVVANGVEVGTLPITAASWVIPDPGGDRVAVFDQDVLSVYVKGAPKWSHHGRNTRSVVWLADGTLVAIGNASIARLDAETGEPKLERCGFAFGMSTTPLTAPPAASACAE
ncbi:MAG TPA: hypothetical protein VH143_19440 [Kofleriaceae bacterium]|nr:hypothetical protein [Kofleriaceae bacterium]